MTNKTIPELPPAGPLIGTEQVPIQQNGLTVQTTVAAIANSPTQQQTFITVNQEPTLANSRSLIGGLGIGTSTGSPQGQFSLFLNGVSASLENASQGIVVKNSGSGVTNRSIATTGAGLSVANANGVSGNPTLGLSGLPSALASLGGTGFISVSGGSTLSVSTITGTANQIGVTGGDGSSLPTISIATNPIIPGSGSITIPNGTTGQRSGSIGAIRYNSTLGAFEGYLSTGWQQFSSAGGVTTFQTSLSGLTPSTPTTGTVTLAGTLNPSSGGTGANTLTGYVVGNGTSPFTATTTIPTTDLSGTISNAQLANSSITINSNTVSLGGSVNVGTITSVTGTAPIQSSGGNTPAISITQASASTNGYLSSTDWNTFNNKQPSGSYVTSVGATSPVSSSGGTTPTISMPPATSTVSGYLTSTDWNTFNNKGSGSVTSVSGTGTVNGITLSGTVTSSGNITLGGALANVANNQLTNSSITINSNVISLGGSATITANTPNALTIGTGLSGTSFNGSTAVTIAIANTGVTAGIYGSATAIPSVTVNAQGQITSITTNALNSPAYQGTWNASTNSPTLTSSVGTNNNYYVVSTAGTTTLNGISLWSVGDWAIFNGTTNVWEKINGSSSEAFTSLTVTGLTGYMYANGTSAVTASTTIPTTSLSGTITNAQLANSSITVNGTSISLGSSGTVTASAGTLTGTTLNSTVVNSSLTSVGTISTGTWQGSIIGTLYGGTGTSVGVAGGAF